MFLQLAALRHNARAAVLAACASANVAAGAALAAGRLAGASILLLPPALLGFGALVDSNRAVLLFVGLGLNLTGLGIFTTPLPMPGSVQIFASDILVLLALVSWLAARLSRPPEARPNWLRSPVLGWPLLLLAITIFLGVLRGHERYGETFFGQPVRLVFYAGIAAAMTDLTARQAYRGIVAVFYAGAVWQFVLALYYLATGTSQTDTLALSTGGVRLLALSTAMYLACALVLAILNLELGGTAWQRVGHATMAGLAAFGIIVALGRTTFAAVGVLLPLLLLALRRARSTSISIVPLFIPILVVAGILVVHGAPDLLPTLRDRISASPSNDVSARWRENAYRVALHGVADEPIRGLGFGRKTSFVIENQTVEFKGDPHNSYIYLLAGGGALALGAFVLLTLVYLTDSVRRAVAATGVERALVVWSLAAWFVFAVNTATGPILTDPQLLLTIWIVMLLPALVRRSAHVVVEPREELTQWTPGGGKSIRRVPSI